MDLFVVVCTLVICLTILLLKQLLSWRSRIIPGIPIASGSNPIVGNLFALSKALEDGWLDYVMENMRATNFTQCHFLAPGLSVVSTCDPGHIEHMFSKEHFPVWIKGKDIQEAFADTLGHGIFAVDGQEWAEKRKVSSYLFSSNSLRHQMTGVFLEHTDRVVDTLSAIADKGEVANLQELFARYTFDSICTIAFGMDVNSLGGNEKDIEFQRNYDVAQMTNSTRLMDPLWRLKRVFGIGLEGQLAPHVKKVDEYLYKIIDYRLKELENDVDRGDMLSLYIKHGQKKNKQFDRVYLRDMVLNFIIAGRDTTAAASMWLIYELSRHPKVEATLLKEIEESIGHDHHPTYDIVTKMPYLRSVFYETLRLHPSVPLDGKFAACDTYLEPGHFFIKKGTQVQFNILMMNRDPKRYKDPEEFIPERWMRDGAFVEMPEKEFPAFNMKPRGCLGKRMAEFEAAVLVSVLLPKFKFRVEDGFVPRASTNVILFNQNGMRVLVEKRGD